MYATHSPDHEKWLMISQWWERLNNFSLSLTSKHVHGSSGSQVNSSRGGARGCFKVTWAHLPPLPCPTVVTETQLTVLSHKAWVADTMLTPLWSREEENNSSVKWFIWYFSICFFYNMRTEGYLLKNHVTKNGLLGDVRTIKQKYYLK